MKGGKAKIWYTVHTKTKGETLPMGNFIVALLLVPLQCNMAGGFECRSSTHYYFCYSCMHEVKVPIFSSEPTVELVVDSRKTVFLFLSQFLYQRELQFPSLVSFSM